MKPIQLKSRIRKGIPDALRCKVWKKILGVNELTKEQRIYYAVVSILISLCGCIYTKYIYYIYIHILARNDIEIKISTARIKI